MNSSLYYNHLLIMWNCSCTTHSTGARKYVNESSCFPAAKMTTSTRYKSRTLKSGKACLQHTQSITNQLFPIHSTVLSWSLAPVLLASSFFHLPLMCTFLVHGRTGSFHRGYYSGDDIEVSIYEARSMKKKKRDIIWEFSQRNLICRFHLCPYDLCMNRRGL